MWAFLTYLFIWLNSLVQKGSNWFKLDQKRSRWISLIVWSKSYKIGSNQIKLVQIGLNQIDYLVRSTFGSNCFKSDQSGFNEINWTKLDQTWSNKNKSVQIRSDWIKRDKIGSSRIKSYETGSNPFLFIFRYPIRWKSKNCFKLGLIDLSPHPCPILCLVIFDYWKTWLKLVMLENLQACFFKLNHCVGQHLP